MYKRQAGVVSTGSGAQTKSTGQLYWEVTMGAAGTYYYQCEYHQAMYGQIDVVAPGGASNPSSGTATGDGSDTTFTITSGRDVDDVLVFVNGICLVPTADYTISGTTLTFQTAPANNAEIVFRYL